MEDILGHFVDISNGHDDYLKISFMPSNKSIHDAWQKNGLSADFIADYWDSFYSKRFNKLKKDYSKMRYGVCYIANELLENAMKHHCQNIKIPITISVYLYPYELFFYVSNCILKKDSELFKTYIQKLLHEDPATLYLYHVERSVSDDFLSKSCLGYVTLLNDYKTQLGWRFYSKSLQSDYVEVTVMVRLNINDNQ